MPGGCVGDVCRTISLLLLHTMAGSTPAFALMRVLRDRGQFSHLNLCRVIIFPNSSPVMTQELGMRTPSYISLPDYMVSEEASKHLFHVSGIVWKGTWQRHVQKCCSLCSSPSVE